MVKVIKDREGFRITWDSSRDGNRERAVNMHETASRKKVISESLPCKGKIEHSLELEFGGELGCSQSKRRMKGDKT